jgi:DNA-binding MarR family transcriptional regulator
MSNKQEFIQFVEQFVADMPEGAQKYFDAMKNVPEKEKPMFTDGGKQILKYLKDNHSVGEALAAKTIAEGMMISSRSVSGSIRKLVTDGFVEKVSTDPVLYALSDKGNEVTID